MAEKIQTPAAGVTPAAGEGAMPPTGGSGVTPATPATLEEATAILAALEAEVSSGRARIAELNKESAKHRKAAADAETQKLQAAEQALIEQGKFKELYDAEVAAHAATKQELGETKRQMLVAKVANAHGLPEELHEYVKGDTEEAMIESVKTLAKGRLQTPGMANDGAEGGAGSSGRRQQPVADSDTEAAAIQKKLARGKYVRW